MVVVLAIAPCAVLGWIFYKQSQQLIEKDSHTLKAKLKEQARANILPIRLQAYERLVILLERIRVNNLAIRTTRPGMNAQYLQKEMMQAIRYEYDHNMSQQLYVSKDSWGLVQAARQQTISAMQIASEKVANNESADAFTRVLMDIAAQPEYNAVDMAINHLRNEMNKLY